MPNKFLISYDLSKPDRDYPKVEAAIKNAAKYAHPLESVWVIESKFSEDDWKQKIAAAVDSDDKYLVTPITSMSGRVDEARKVGEIISD